LMESWLVGKNAVWTGRIVLTKEQAVNWTLRGEGDVKLEINGVERDMRNTESVTLGVGSHTFKVTYSREVPARIALFGNTPNPFNATTAIAFQLPAKEHVAIEVFDISGRRVTRLADGEFGEGTHRIVWNGRGDSGMDVASGVYFVVMKAGGRSFQHKMLLIK
ncbi:MAG TPA: T9SS type A sorting domain-containing protein, partial [candidate division Zixibacteria bacterium]|nr:T9SS type A sorting domain-containing protein [candidate division Zixibacteria bacterium]